MWITTEEEGENDERHPLQKINTGSKIKTGYCQHLKFEEKE